MGKSMAIVTVGVDLAKNVFAVHGVDATGKPVLVPQRGARGAGRPRFEPPAGSA
jgi:transposase